jgi:O-antigen/teichoic acid export membrane protein
MGSKKKLLKNSAMSFLQQIVTLLYGLLIPRLILEKYGSDVNGTIASITQFISITSLIQGGFSNATRVAYYAPVAKKDDALISVVNKTSLSLFRRFGIVLANYVIVLGIIYPRMVNIPFSYSQGFMLIMVLALNAFFECFFGLSNQLLLFADQKDYINSGLIIFCTVTNGLMTAILIYLDFSIIFVKFIASLIFILRPVFLYFYVRKHYNLDTTVNKNKELLVQSKDAFAASVAFYVHKSTDNIVITALLDVVWVSIYSVHRYVVGSVSTLVASVLGNTEVVFGQLFALDGKDKLRREIPVYDLMIKILSTIVFFTCAACINQFVGIYTKNVKDTDYFHPVFALIMCAAEYIYCTSLTYNNMIMAAGHIRQTKWISIVEALTNIILSVILVFKFGIIGVAVGTLIAFCFNTIANYAYMKKNLLEYDTFYVFKEYAVNIGFGAAAVYAINTIGIVSSESFLSFIITAMVAFALIILVILGANYVFFNEQMKPLVAKARDYIRKKRLGKG